MKKVELTRLEKEAIKGMYEDVFCEEAIMNETYIFWQDTAMEAIVDFTEITISQLSGVISSLVKKGIIYSYGDQIEITNVPVFLEVIDYKG